MNHKSFLFQCPGCKMTHQVPFGNEKGMNWDFNGDRKNPTFKPSLLVTYPANPNAIEEFKEWRTERKCHSFVTDGMIQFLGDCTHELAGKTVPLEEPEWIE